MTDVDLQTLIPLLIPVLLIEVVLWVICFLDLAKRDKVKGGSKVVWALVILLTGFIGPVVYLVWGRNVEAKEEKSNGSGDKD